MSDSVVEYPATMQLTSNAASAPSPSFYWDRCTSLSTCPHPVSHAIQSQPPIASAAPRQLQAGIPSTQPAEGTDDSHLTVISHHFAVPNGSSGSQTPEPQRYPARQNPPAQVASLVNYVPTTSFPRLLKENATQSSVNSGTIELPTSRYIP